MAEYYVYLMSNASHTLYVGVTNNLELRVRQHQAKEGSAFTAKYNVHRLAYYEVYNSINTAIAREKQTKAWSREKKVALILEANPRRRDLSEDW